MTRINRAGALVLTVVVLLAAASPAHAQVDATVWRGVARTLGVGAQVTMRLANGQRFHATLLEVQDDRVLLQPKTRVPVPVQGVPYDAIVSLERRAHSKGAGVAKAVAIGGATGVAAFFLTVLIVFAAVD